MPSRKSSTHTRRSSTASSWHSCIDFGLCFSATCSANDLTRLGERIPLEAVYADGSDSERMHNMYTHLYNKAVHEVLVEELGEGEATLFARSATAGGQQYPVHWGGDSTSTFTSMAETLRGGLSLAFSGFGYWSHDIGGFEGTPDPAVFKRDRLRSALESQPSARERVVPRAVAVRR